MINALGTALIAALSATEIYCLGYIRGYLRERSEERTEARRAAYRAKAYSSMEERRTLKTNRQRLWRSIQK